MLIYNITILVSWSVHDKWLPWIQHQYIPDILGTGCFFESNIFRILEVEEEEGPTYAIQFHAQSMEHYKNFIEQYQQSFTRRLSHQWSDGIASFESIMELLH